MEDLIWVDWHEHKNLYIVFVDGHALNKHSCSPSVANNLAKRMGQKSFQLTTYSTHSLPKKERIDVY